MSALLENITISLRTSRAQPQHILIQNLSLAIEDGSVLTVMGNSGSGKSSLLNFITGVIDTHAFDCEGRVIVDGRNLCQVPTEKRKIGFLSQEGLLFPHMTVRENLLYAVPNALKKEEKKIVVQNTLEDAKLPHRLASVYPHTLSGGQQARLALARTLLSKPRMLLLDEPFSKLDTDLRAAIREWVWGKIEENTIPAILVSHDLNDVYSLKLLHTIAH
ncbi:uncharacterized ABC transporter ATP-binding protein YnjD-like [Ylistrum balloti]|uniref:uncharacterized ABC transporter ATP-binding protein YnjD-like n=1 Tax=Ylistrum balloti TaxID=509963 RepID=UPI002905C8D3|nr:uncharacterized ABC transporter ATP-binding protein YnjD-like [Ylistrum balloti]